MRDWILNDTSVKTENIVLTFDATAKIKGEEVNGNPVRDWPRVVSMDPAIQALVEKRWKEYGF